MGQTGTANTLKAPHSTIRFYHNQLLLNKNKYNCKRRCEYKIINPSHWLMDFLIARTPGTSDNIQEWGLYDYETGSQTHVCDTGSLEIKNFGDVDYIFWCGNTVNGYGYSAPSILDVTGWVNKPLVCGKTYQIRVRDDYKTYYSEPIVIEASDYDYRHDDPLDGTWTEISGGGGSITGNAIVKAGATPWVVEYTLNTEYDSRWVEIAFKLANTGDFTFPASTAKFYIDGVLVFTLGPSTVRPVDGWIRLEGYVSGTSGRVLRIEFSDFAAGTMTDIRAFPDNYGIKCHTHLVWRQTCGDVGNMPMKDYWTIGLGYFTNYFFYDQRSEISEPLYKMIVEVKEDGEGKKVEQFMRREKRYQIQSEQVPEFIVDALFDIPLFDEKRIIFKDSGGLEVMYNVTVTPKFLFDKCFATVTLEFGVGDDVTQNNCCDEIPVVPCLVACNNEVQGRLEDADPPTEGFLYFSDAEGQNIVEYHVAGNVLLPCDTGYLAIQGTDIYYHFDGTVWQHIGVNDVIPENPFDLENTRSFVVAYIPPGFFGYIVITCGGDTETGTVVYTPAELLSGVLIEPCDTEFTVEILYGNLNCNYVLSDDYAVDWGLRAKILKSSYEGLGYEYYSVFQFDGIGANACDLSAYNIAYDDLAGLEPHIENGGGFCNMGDYTMSDNGTHIFIERTDASIYLDGSYGLNIVIPPAVVGVAIFFVVFDRNHLNNEMVQ